MKHEDCKVGMKCRIANDTERYAIIADVNPASYRSGAVEIRYFSMDGTPWRTDISWGIMADLLEPFEEVAPEKSDAEICPSCGVPLEWCSMALKCPECWKVF
jgi:hypothetical protein